MKSYFFALIIALFLVLILSSCMPNLRTDFPKRAFVFPKDMAPHRDYNSEWWYQTGYLYTDNSSTPTFGYEFTAFRFYQPSTNRWPKLLFMPVGEIWDVHFMLHDFKTGKRIFTEELIPPSMLFFSAVQTASDRLYLKGGDEVRFLFSGDQKNMKLNIQYGKIKLDFDLAAEKPPVPHNDGLVTMDTARSYYYSITRLDVTGSLVYNGTLYKVHGNSWYDQQWGDMEDLSPWDWFSLRLNNDEELMIFRFPKTGEAYATYVKKDGSYLYANDVKIELENEYSYNGKKIPIPMPGHIEIPSLNATFTINAISKDQYNITRYTPSYWEGLCTVNATISNLPVAGYAYFEGWR